MVRLNKRKKCENQNNGELCSNNEYVLGDNLKTKEERKEERKEAKIEKKRKKGISKTAKKRKKTTDKINKLNEKLNHINQLILSESKYRKIKKLKKKKVKTEARIERANIAAIPRKQRSSLDRLRAKLGNFKLWIIILLVLIFLFVCVATIWLYIKYEEASYYMYRYMEEQAYSEHLSYNVDLLTGEKSDLESTVEQQAYEISDLESTVEQQAYDISSLEDEISVLKDEKSSISLKADWFDQACKIVVANEGSLFKTYHTYACDKWRNYSIWIYNKEQVIHNSDYIKCPDCNKE